MDHLFKTQDEAVSAALEFARTQPNRRPEPCADPIHAMWGVEVVGPRDEVPHARYGRKGTRFLYPRFKHPLEAVIKEVSPDVLVAAMLSAKEGLYAQGDDPYERVLQACHYDLERGMSFVSKTRLVQVMDMGPPERGIFTDKGWRSQSGRLRLGGFNVAGNAEYAQLRELLNPFLLERGRG